MNATPGLEFRWSPPLRDEELNQLFRAAWPDHVDRTYQAVLRHSLAYIGAFADEDLIGFVSLAWDGQSHAFVLNPTVHPRWRLRGVGRALVKRAAEVAATQGVEWLHVDYEPQLAHFYQSCGFRRSTAGVQRLVPRA